MNLLEKIIDTFYGQIIDEYDITHYKIPGKKYDIQLNSRREWSCDCPAYRWQKKSKIKSCKHIKWAKAKRFKWLAGS